VKAAATPASKPPTGAIHRSVLACLASQNRRCWSTRRPASLPTTSGDRFDALQSMIPAAFFKSMGYTDIAKALGGYFVGQNNETARDVTARWPNAYPAAS
jgi:hypothetical protein